MKQTELKLGVMPATGSGELACGERPQERLEMFGAGALSDTELLALVVGAHLPARRRLALCSRLMAEAGSLRKLVGLHSSDIQRMAGISRSAAKQVIALGEISRRMLQPTGEGALQLDRCDKIASYFAPLVCGLEVEKFWVVCLNRKFRLKKVVELTSGTATSTLVHARDVFRAAIREGALAVIGVHNHPSGDPAPSNADMVVTRQLREAAKMIEIEFIDHVVLGRVNEDPRGKGYFSFREAGLI